MSVTPSDRMFYGRTEQLADLERMLDATYKFLSSDLG
jgi:hypothetical protein